MRSPEPAKSTVWSPTMSPPRMLEKPMVEGSRSPVTGRRTGALAWTADAAGVAAGIFGLPLVALSLVIGLAMVFEGGSFAVAWKEFRVLTSGYGVFQSLRGSKDPGVGIDRYVEGLRHGGLTNVEAAEIADSGHFAPDEQPEVVAQALERFLGLGATAH